jgi:hypothetical protein
METFVRKGYEEADFFIGPEIEHTTAFGKKTLFVRGLQETSIVEELAREHKASHIFIGCSRSFDSLELRNDVYMVGDTFASDWEKQIHSLLDRGFLVTLDYPAHKHYDVLKVLNPGIWKSRNFIPMLAVPIPCVQTSSINLTIKIDDSNFGETNPGVWCLNHHEVTDSNRFTHWKEYGDDMIINAPSAVKSLSVTEKVAVVIQPRANVAVVLAAPRVDTPNLNSTELGLDALSGSSLKSDPDDVIKAISAPVDAAEAYADGATEDPLSKPVKSTKKVKGE